ncbi:hypothetical protein [Scytonema sp. NUACC26]|uniref:hypothetical protein n=1 Tax=Scytonema sp. NUACC26 TaxID=3140176 RepID=UPI0034DCC39D
MSDLINKQILLKSRPVGEPTESDFALVETSIPEPGNGEILTRTIYLSLDPYMRGPIGAGKSYTANVELNSAIVGGTVSQVVKSNHPHFQARDFVLDYNGWQTFGVSKAESVRKLDPTQFNDQSGQNRSVSVGDNATGSAIITGDSSTANVNFQQVSLPAPASVNIQAELNALREILANIETSDRHKIDNAFADAQEELNKPQPDKDE